jgi:hypothetical protein
MPSRITRLAGLFALTAIAAFAQDPLVTGAQRIEADALAIVSVLGVLAIIFGVISAGVTQGRAIAGIGGVIFLVYMLTHAQQFVLWLQSI